MNRRTLWNVSLILLSSFMLVQCTPKGNDKFIDDLMSQMTLQEKIGQLNLLPTGPITTASGQNTDILDDIRRGEVGGIFNLKGVRDIRIAQDIAVKETRLGIPILFAMDVIHGYETIFPIPLALSCSWDMAAIEKSARIAACEASADGIAWTFSPMVDICKDARWGRVAEGAGEDPFLGAAIAKAMIKGYQGEGLKNNNEIMACVKHFALYGASESGRDYNMVDMSPNRMYNEYFLPYQAAIEAGAGSVMSSFNDINGIPATANKWLLTDVLRKQWGFNGLVTTDHSAIVELTNHSIGNLESVSARALQAGTDMDMGSRAFVAQLEKALKDGKITENDIDIACRRVLEAKQKLGLFEDPYRFLSDERAESEIYTESNRAEARKIATETFVLLKNENQLLPLQRKGKIALIGPLGNTRTQMQGTWAVAAVPSKYSTILEAMQRNVGERATIRYAKGSNFMYDEKFEERTWVNKGELPHLDDEQLLKEALEIANWSDIIIATLGEPAELSGESSCRTNLEMPDAQHDLLQALVKTGKPVVLLHFSGRPTVMNWEQKNVPAIMNVWFAGSETGDAICDVIFGDVSPSGKLTTTFPQTVGQLPMYYNHRNTSRPQDKDKWFEKFRSNYIDVTNDPLYPFGYGLSYTTFDYSPMKLSANELNIKNDSLIASITISNKGEYDADEIIQMYIRDIAGSITRPVQELKGFQRIHLKKGESREITFTITPELLKFYNNDLDFVCEPGEFELMIGPNSRDVERCKFILTE